MLELLKADIKPRDIMTRAAFENAMVIVMALGGSTNAVLHLLAMARACGVALTLDDFQACSDRTPFIADLKPSGKYVMEDVHKVRSEPVFPSRVNRVGPRLVTVNSKLILSHSSQVCHAVNAHVTADSAHRPHMHISACLRCLPTGMFAAGGRDPSCFEVPSEAWLHRWQLSHSDRCSPAAWSQLLCVTYSLFCIFNIPSTHARASGLTFVWRAPGKTMAENLECVPDLSEGQQVIMPLERPIKATGHLQVHS